MSDMEITVKTDRDERGTPYRGMRIVEDGGTFAVTFRRYQSRTFVGVEDNRDNLSSGADLDDCWIAPTIIIAKIPNREFAPIAALRMALHHAGLDEWISDEDQLTIIKKWRTE